VWSDYSPVPLRLLAHFLYSLLGCIKENETCSCFSVIFTVVKSIYFCIQLPIFAAILSQTSKMGKKSRVKTQKSGTGATAVVSPKEMMNLISELLQSEYKKLYGCIYALKYCCNDFLSWMCALLLHKRIVI